MSRSDSPRTRRVFGLAGGGGMGREVMSFVQPRMLAQGISCFFVEKFADQPDWHGLRCLTEEEFFSLDVDEYLFNVSVADSMLRARLVEQMISAGGTLASLVHDSAFIGTGVDLGPGAVICAFSALTADCRIGRNFQCNIYSRVAHDCVIGDNVTFAPGVHCNGNIRIEDHAYIGTGAIIRPGTSSQKLVIGQGAVVGMGAVVTKNVAPYTTVVGNPARVLEKS